MTADLSFVAGLALAGLALLSLIARYAEGRSPRAAVLLGVLAAGLIGYAEVTSPEGYSVAGIPMVVIRVVGDFTN